MKEELFFTYSCQVHTSCICFSFIRWLILLTVPLSVVWRRALFSSTPRWFALLYTKTVKIILWALYLQPTLKSFSHTALSPVRSAWVGKSPEQNTLKQWSQCFYYTLTASQTLFCIWTFRGPDFSIRPKSLNIRQYRLLNVDEGFVV